MPIRVHRSHSNVLARYTVAASLYHSRPVSQLTPYIRRVNSRLVPLVSTCRAPNYLGFIIPDRNCSKLCVASVHLDLLAGSSLAPLRGFITGSDGRVSPRHLRHPRLSALCLNYIMTTNLEEISRTNILNTTYYTGLS